MSVPVRQTLLLGIAAFTAGVLGVTTAGGQPPAGDAKKLDPELVAAQGEWLITKIDMPDGLLPPEHLKTAWVTVRGNRVSLFAPWRGKVVESQHGLLTVDASKTPRQLDVTPTDSKGVALRQFDIVSDGKGGDKLVDIGPEPAIQTIYKLEAGKMVVCFPVSIRKEQKLSRPTAFKASSGEAREDPYVVLIQLTKKQ
jgi:uncharacterized protein (TIGR03067 family)